MEVAATAAKGGSLSPSSRPDTPERRAAEAFEAVFLGQMTQLMMGAADADGMFDGGHGEEMFRGILAEKLGGVIAARGGIGLAPRVLDEIIRLQGGNADAT